jgi:hypothetical protein
MQSRSFLRHPKRLALLLAAAALAVPAFASVSQAAQGPQKTLGKHGAKAALHRVVPVFSDELQALGSTTYQNAYGGAISQSSGRLIIFVVRSKGASFIQAIRREATAPHAGPAGYTIRYVAHSWAQLLGKSTYIVSRDKELRAQGIKLARVTPEAASNKLQLALEVYRPAFARKLLAMFGARWISVSSRPETWASTSDRWYDSSPFFGGDAVWFGGQTSSSACTAGFTLSFPNSSGGTDYYSMTAGHCATAAGAGVGKGVYTNLNHSYKYGTVAVNYFTSDHDDVVAIGPGSYADSGEVWGDNGVFYTVKGTTKPLAGQAATADGAVSHEVTGVTIENVDNDIYEADFSTWIYFVTIASKSGATVCQDGDSGGPWYVHIGSTGGVNAAGTQAVQRIDPDGKPDPSVCGYQQIGWTLGKTGGKITTG